MYEDFDSDELMDEVPTEEMSSEINLDDLEDSSEGNPVLVKTFDGSNTGLSETSESDEFETENLDKVYGNVLDSISDDESLDNSDKIERLTALREQYLSEFDNG